MIVVQVSPQRLMPFGWLLTNVQVNITIYTRHIAHTSIHHTYSYHSCFSSLHIFQSSWQAGCPLLSLSVTGSHIFLLHFAVGRCDSLQYLRVESQILPLQNAVGIQLLPLHHAARSQILQLQNAAGSQILPLHDAAGRQILVSPNDAAGSQVLKLWR